MLFGTVRVRDLVIFVISGDEIQEYRTTFKNLEFVAIFILVRKGGYAAIGIDLKEPWTFLFVFIEIQRYDLHSTMSVG